MFCSRRKSPSAPCSRAFLLRGPLSGLLNHLSCVGESTPVWRQQGLTLAKSTRFGPRVKTRESGWRVLRGMATDTRQPLSSYLLAIVGDRKPVIGMAAGGHPLHATIRLDRHDWSSPPIPVSQWRRVDRSVCKSRPGKQPFSRPANRTAARLSPRRRLW
jgi:hypothetical protein